MPVTDEEAALQAVATLETLSDEQQAALQSINAILQDGEPFVDVHELFRHYDVLYFQSLLSTRVEVLWSPRLTLCAGICELSKDLTTGKYTRIRLKLSTPLLQYRPRTDTVNTLLHEAIHAYFFVTTSWRHSRGDDGMGHGAGFLLLADAVNNHGNYEVTVYHTFHDEVDSYRTHIWQCEGPCRDLPPYFGLAKRSMNRAPGKSDSWWASHEADCGGTYTKIQEPELTKKQRDALSKKERAGLQKNKLDAWISRGDASSQRLGADAGPAMRKLSSGRSGSRRKPDIILIDDDDDDDEEASKRIKADPGRKVAVKAKLVQCPICTESVAESSINQHLDVVHAL